MNSKSVIQLGFSVQSRKRDKQVQQFKVGFTTKWENEFVLTTWIVEDGYPFTINYCGTSKRIDNHEELLKFLYNDLAKNECLMSKLRALYALNQPIKTTE